MAQWKECQAYQQSVVKWCKENVDQTQGFPYWQLGGRSGGFCVPDVTEDIDDFIPVFYESVFIMNEADRLAFTLKFPVIEWI